MAVTRSPVRSPVPSLVYGPTVGKWGSAAVPLDNQIIAMLTAANDAYYRVSDLNTVFSDRGGASATTPAVVDGLVGTIKDKGPNGRHLVCTSDAARGTLRFVGGVYYVESNGVDTKYETAALTASPWTTYIAATGKRPSTTGARLLGRVGGLTQYAFVICANALAQMGVRNTGGQLVTATAAASWAANTFNVADGYTVPSLSAIALSGASFTTAVSALVEETWGGVHTLFRDSGGAAAATAACFSGGVILNRVPSDAERATIVLTLRGLYDPAVLTDLGLVL